MPRLFATFSLLFALTIATLIKTLQKISENLSQIVDKFSPNFNSPSVKVTGIFVNELLVEYLSRFCERSQDRSRSQ